MKCVIKLPFVMVHKLNKVKKVAETFLGSKIIML